jgi:hypothetical protein
MAIASPRRILSMFEVGRVSKALKAAEASRLIKERNERLLVPGTK